jgi:AraC family transcriptional regulator of adaptative response/methylated-DNA-[protein]-cysteine methyltransferase
MNSTAKSAMAATVAMDPRWAAFVAREATADGQFYVAVKTTGVYCRPVCPARQPRPENIAFYDTREEAAAAGFRPCKRCKPDQASSEQELAAKITEACRLIEEAEEAPRLDELAEAVGVSAYYFHRRFKQATGLTPRQYAAAHREQAVRQRLTESSTVTEAIYDAGYNSSGRFYESSNDVLGMTPTDYRAGGQSAQIHFAVGECSLGSILVAKTERGVCAILMGDDPDELTQDLQNRFPRANLIGGDAEFEKLVAQVVGFIEAPTVGLNLPLDVRGTAFQQRVWQALRKIPAGSTVSYTEIAERIGSPKSVRAVAQACGANKIAVAIPCHRVVRTDGGLSGYRWGVDRKRALLNRETGVRS